MNNRWIKELIYSRNWYVNIYIRSVWQNTHHLCNFFDTSFTLDLKKTTVLVHTNRYKHQELINNSPVTNQYSQLVWMFIFYCFVQYFQFIVQSKYLKKKNPSNNWNRFWGVWTNENINSTQINQCWNVLEKLLFQTGSHSIIV